MSAGRVLFWIAYYAAFFCVGFFGKDIIRKLRRLYGNWTHHSGDRSQAGAPTPTGFAIAAAVAANAPAGEVGARPRVVVDQEILAERGWYLFRNDGRFVLRSLNFDVFWEGPTLVADKRPALDHPHGIYALRPEQLPPVGQHVAVMGTVALSGVVIEGERGYRAERATVRSLVLRGPAFNNIDALPLRIAEELAERYQCEVSIQWLPTSDLPATELTV